MPRLWMTVALGVCCATASLQADDWPQFRGPNSSGISTSEKSPPVEFGLEKNLAWSAEIGDGIGCPIVAAGRVFVSAMVNPETVGLFAYDAKSGEKIWERTWPAGDLAVQIEIGRILGHDERPAEKLMRELAEGWRPHRGAAAILAWHHYKVDMNVI